MSLAYVRLIQPGLQYSSRKPLGKPKDKLVLLKVSEAVAQSKTTRLAVIQPA